VILRMKASVVCMLFGISFFTACGGKAGDRVGQRMAPSLFGDADPEMGESDDATSEPPVDAVLPGEEDMEYHNLLRACGGINPEAPEALILDQTLKAYATRQQGTESIGGIPVRYQVDFDGELIIKSSINKNDLNRTLSLIEATPQLAARKARERLAAQSGELATDYVPYSERSALSDVDAAWDGVICTIQPALKTVNTVGRRVVVTYNKPLPIHVSPIAVRERYELEHTGQRRWELEATIVESEHPDLPVGRVIPGFVTIEPVSPEQVVTLPDASSIVVRGDFGIRIQIRFGSDQMTNMMGLTPDSTYLIDHTRRIFRSITADIKDGSTPVVTFAAQEAEL
jgi:hypothetical protein